MVNVYKSITLCNASIARFIKHGHFTEALCCFEQMQNSGTCPNAVTFSCALKASSSLIDINKGREIYIDIVKRGLLDKDTIIGSSLVHMYFASGSPTEAEETFSRLAVRDSGLWNVLISGYIKEGCETKALNCFHEMVLEGVSPDAITFTCELHVCRRIRDAANGLELHIGITKMGLLEEDLVLASTLVDMYAKWGFLTDSFVVFERVPEKNVGLWNSLMAGYVAHEHYENAMFFVQQMQQEGVTPDTITYTCMLKAAGNVRDVGKIKQVHSVIESNGSLGRHEIIGNVLVDAYAKNGLLTEAHGLFDKLAVQNLASWTALISGYVEQECGEEALSCFEHMKLQGIHPDTLAYVCSLKACGSIGALGKGMEIHADIREAGQGGHPDMGNALVYMYMRCGCLGGAQSAFDDLPSQDRYVWTSLVSGYTENGHAVEALACFKRMQLEGVTPDGSTFAWSMKACSSSLNGSRNIGREIHAGIARTDLPEEEDVKVGNALVNMYVRWGEFKEARRVLESLPKQGSESWNALIVGYLKRGFFAEEEVLDIFEQMQRQDAAAPCPPPDAITFTCTLVACGMTGAMDKGKSIHAELERQEFNLARDRYIQNALIGMYSKCGELERAEEVFERLPVREDVAWDAVMTGYALRGETQQVVRVMEEMRGDGRKPSGITLVSLLSGCSHGGMVDEAGMVYWSVVVEEQESLGRLGVLTEEHNACVVDVLARAGQLEAAMAVIQRLPYQPDMVVWSALLGACRKWGDLGLGLFAFLHTLEVNDLEDGAYACIHNMFRAP